MAASIESMFKKVQAAVEKLSADVEALGNAIEAADAEDHSGTRKQMEELHEQFTALIAKAKVYASKAQDLSIRADAEQTNASNFLGSADEIVTSLEAASEAMDPDQWDWGKESAT